jgi:hypothetical protein
VPSTEAIRQAALSASWARDRRVARRRLAWRWLLWAGWRIGLPLLLALALVAWLLWPIAPSGTPVWPKPFLSVVTSQAAAPADAASPFPTPTPSQGALTP